ncbi:MAG: DNA/RNA non-specific endonuclease [Muribaculaceae bacterium]|nr:DNA/RNA non-specific endonuclease [Muribaculaceae bacterium]
MKKPYIILFILGAALLIAIGVYGLTCSRRVSTGNNSGITGIAASGKGRVTSEADKLLNVTIPADIPSQIKDYEGFRLSFNKDNHTPNWVAWELLASEVGGDLPRAKGFWNDPEIEGCPVTADYKNSGYDRGHLCPAADQKWSEQAMNDCFYLTNICPQNKSLNTGAWNTLENKERTWAQRDSAILIVAGPIYEKSDRERIGQTGVRVPSAFFKVLAAPYLDNPRGIAFVYPNMAAPGNMENYMMTIDEVEKITGYDFFSELPDNIENEIESKASFKEWNRR